MKRTLAAGLAALLMASTAIAAPVKVGMITTLSGGGAGLGIDVRDGFMLALKQAGDAGAEIEVITEDDQQKPEVGVQLADKMIQSDNVDILTGIIFSNIALAVVPAAVKQGKFYLSPNAGPSQLAGKGCDANYFNVAYQNDNQHEAAGEYANTLGYKKTFILAPNYPAGKDCAQRLQALLQGRARRRALHQARPDRLRRRDRPDQGLRRRQRLLLPARRHGHLLHQAVRQLRHRPADDRPRLLLRPGRARRRRRRRARRPQHRPVVARPRQRRPTRPSSRPSRPSTAACPRSTPARATTPPTSSSRRSAKADVADHDAFHAALKAADFPTVRGSFKFGNNQHPIQNFYAREVVKRDDGVITNRIVGTAFENHVDAYAAECPMQ